MNTLQKSKLQISLNNLDNITNSTLKFFFKSNLCDKAQLKTQGKDIDVFIIDSDRKFDQEFISNLKANNQFVIFLHNQMNNPIQEENTYNVTKPVQVKYLKQQLHFIFNRLQEINNTKQQTVLSNNNNKNIIQKTENKIAPSQLFEVIKKRSYISKHQNNHLDKALKDTTEISTLNQYRAHKYVGSNLDINPDNSEELKKIFHNPKKYLYHYLAKAVKMGKTNNSDIIIKTLFGNLLFDFKSQLILHQFSKAKMRYFKSSPLFLETELILTSISAKTKEINTNCHEHQSLIWEAAVRASKGRIPLGSSLTQSVKMSAWPNFSRLQIFRYSIQITAAWSTHHMSLLDTASQLHLPQRYIFTLYNAMLAIECAKINNVVNNVSKINSDKRKSVFSKILSHIFNH